MSVSKRSGSLEAKKPSCPACGSREVRYLRRTNTIHCRVCGAEWPAKWVHAPKKKGGGKRR